MNPQDKKLERKRVRRALTHVGGAVATWGDELAAQRLAEALDVAPAEPGPTGEARASGATQEGEDPGRAHVHGFHSYPARMHPTTAARLVHAFSEPGELVLDPFCGSGTVLVEAARLGRRAIGTDLNPLAVELSRLKVSTPDEAARKALLDAAEAVRAFADERRKARAGATRRFRPEDVASFAPHVLLELDSVQAGIVQLAPEKLRTPLLLVLSAILTKVSERAADSARYTEKKRVAAGYPAKLFVKKAAELCARKAELAALVEPGTPTPRVYLDDATELRHGKRATVDLVVTSPPYAATYDYLEHHEDRLRWLGLDARGFEKNELGSRRRYRDKTFAEAKASWTGELRAVFATLRRVMKPGADAAFLVADSAVGNDALWADELVPAAAEAEQFTLIAAASQDRPHFHAPTQGAFRQAPRREHALLFRSAAATRR
ncbi:MAG: hypothetical protein HOO96_41880 [Polyangiaceae bacterium]|nr:hypothetical protein [Polyangiaceae bacterium]